MIDEDLNECPKSKEAEKEVAEESNITLQTTFATSEKQIARSFLRERFLRAMAGIAGSQATFQLYENTKVCGEFQGCDVDLTELYVKNLQTPIGTVPEAILRVDDVMYFDIENI